MLESLSHLSPNCCNRLWLWRGLDGMWQIEKMAIMMQMKYLGN